jgi:sulfur-carrier protein
MRQYTYLYVVLAVGADIVYFHLFMARINFTGNVQRHLRCPSAAVDGRTVGDALRAYFGTHPAARGYVLDDQGHVRKHVLVLIDGLPIRDRAALSDPLAPDSDIYVFQALSGG